MKLGFTGTQRGMTQAQLTVLADALRLSRTGDDEFHHGNCVGADTEAAIVAKLAGFNSIVAYPSNIPSKQGTAFSHERREPKPPLDRNHDIVDAVDVLIAAPATPHEVLRSGTWATVRYARKCGKDTAIILPDGSISLESNLPDSLHRRVSIPASTKRSEQ